jgi:CO/xanthine dehydrogenase FAD-binding subunit
VRPKKDKPNRTRFTVGGDRINYPGEVAMPTADMLVTKILFNSVISARGARLMTIDISNFYLMTPLKQPEYIRVKNDGLPREIVTKYKLRAMVNKSGMVYIEVTKGMYGLPQARLLVNELLKQRLNKHG